MAPFAFLLAALVQAATPAAAPPPGWRPLGMSGNGRETFYDPASVVRAGPVTRLRLRFTEESGYMLSNIELRCAAYEARVAGMTAFAPDGREISRNEMMTPFRAIVAGSFLERLATEVCGAATGPARPQ
jgi:hypothetical protein